MSVSSRQLILRADRLIDGTGSEAIEDGAVVVDGSRISAVGRFSDLEGRAQGEVLHFTRKTLLPGLVDAHTHLTLSGTGRTYEQEALDSDELMAVRAVYTSQVHLRSGVTTLRDNGGRNRVTFIVREAQRQGLFFGPRLLLSGRPVTHSGGHFHWCNGVADGPEGIRRAVRALVSEGADHIKIMASGGNTAGNDPGLPSYTADELRVAVETAHGLHRLTTAHCRATQSMANAVEAGLDCMEHASFHEHVEPRRSGEPRMPSFRTRYDRAVAERIAASGMFVSLTLQANAYHSMRRLQAKRQREMLTEAEQRRIDAIEPSIDEKLTILRNLLDLNMLSRIVLSTDAGPADVDFGRLYYSLELGVLAGITPMQVICSATGVAARACGVAEAVGTLQAGKEADILVVDGNPLEDIRAMAKVAAVYKGGVAVPNPGALPEPSC